MITIKHGEITMQGSRAEVAIELGWLFKSLANNEPTMFTAIQVATCLDAEKAMKKADDKLVTPLSLIIEKAISD